MVSKLRLCRATQFARASASATVIIASTSTASCSPKIKVDVIGSKPSASPKGLGRSPTIAFPGAVKTLRPSVFDVMGAVMRVVSLNSYKCSFSMLEPFPNRSSSPVGRNAGTTTYDWNRGRLRMSIGAAGKPQSSGKGFADMDFYCYHRAPQNARTLGDEVFG